jgi:hypothetical protein
MKTNKISKSRIFTLEDLEREKVELLHLRYLKRQQFIEYKDKIINPVNIMFMIGKPLLKKISWLSIALSVGKKVYGIIKK